MAYMWLLDSRSEWVPIPLEESDVYYLTTDASRAVVPSNGDRPRDSHGYVMRHTASDGSDLWLLYTAPTAPVFLNGSHVRLGMHALRDHDQIRVGSCNRLFYTSERLARVEPFPGLAKTAKCPRCCGTIEKGQPSVKCPTCGTWYHQGGKLLCWTYDKTCLFDKQPTSLEAGFRWTPAEL